MASKLLKISAHIRYWEDSDINGEPDVNGEMPFRFDDYWKPTIDILSGRVLNWPNITARIHYKICDEGEYYLIDKDQTIKYPGYYVPKILDCSVDQTSFGDYIILNIDQNGFINNWNPNKIEQFYSNDWTF